MKGTLGSTYRVIGKKENLLVGARGFYEDSSMASTHMGIRVRVTYDDALPVINLPEVLKTVFKDFEFHKVDKKRASFIMTFSTPILSQIAGVPEKLSESQWGQLEDALKSTFDKMGFELEIPFEKVILGVKRDMQKEYEKFLAANPNIPKENLAQDGKVMKFHNMLKPQSVEMENEGIDLAANLLAKLIAVKENHDKKKH